MSKKSLPVTALLLSIVCSNLTFGQTVSPVRLRTERISEIPTVVKTRLRVPQDPAAIDAIKLAVTQYFDWLNRADKEGALHASSMKPNTTLRESQGFLASKNDVLEALEYSNQLNGVKIESQSIKLVFRSVSVNNQAKFAEVEVAERYERKYEYFAEPATGETIHAVRLKYDVGQWQIVDDTVLNANDIPASRADKASLMENIRQEANLRRTTEQHLLLSAGVTEQFLKDQRQRLTKEGLDARAVEERLTAIVNEKMSGGEDKTSGNVAADSITTMMYVNRGYNRTACKAYIDKWWNGRNPAWGNFDSLGGDCTNWVSQIINAGGVPEDKTGSYQWYWDNMNSPRTSPPYTRSASWAGVKELWSYIQGNTNNNGPNGPQGQWWSNSSGLSQMNTGDFIQLYRSSTGWFHTYGVYDGKWVNLKPWWCAWCADDWRYKVRVTSHYQDRWRDDLDSVAAAYPTRRYVRITGWYQP